MGKTKIKTIDDSAEKTEEKPHFAKAPRGKDELVEKLKQELGIEEPKKDAGQALPAGRQASMTKKAIETKKPVSLKKQRSKKYLEVSKDLDRSKFYSLPEAIDLVKKLSYFKFNGTLEAHINTSTLGIRGLISLPFVSGKKLRILAFEGDDGVLEQIQNNKIDFDLIITTPQWMAKLTKVAKILGPKGLMPNPKNGTITSDIKKTVVDFQTGKTEYKTEAKTPIIHLALGKLNQPNQELEANIKAVVAGIGKTKIKKITLSSTMSPGVKLDLASI